jgi:hypothetical protein
MANEVVRDEKGRLVKGSASPNASGLDRKKAMMLRNLEDLTPRAISRLGKLVESDNESVALASAKEILDRTLGKSKQSVSVDLTSSGALHLQALQVLADRAKQIERDEKIIDVTPTVTVDMDRQTIDMSED